MKVSFSN